MYGGWLFWISRRHNHAHDEKYRETSVLYVWMCGTYIRQYNIERFKFAG